MIKPNNVLTENTAVKKVIYHTHSDSGRQKYVSNTGGRTDKEANRLIDV